MKTLLIAITAFALSSAAALARDVTSTAPDNDTLSHVSAPVVAQADYSATASIRNGQVIVKNDPATMPD